ncbi:hypothetical protein [Sphingopyxis sp.]|uniref:hypothetical protein n=1 Tax=Sphingopyxis sp. TaxID=1908224 RepID=UPI004037381C
MSLHPDTAPRADADTYADQRAILHTSISRAAFMLDVHPDDYVQMLGEFQATAVSMRTEIYGATPTN